MADAEPSRSAGKTAIGNKSDLFAHALPVKGGGGGKHLPHARTTLGAFIANNDHVAFFILARVYGAECIFLAVKTPRRPPEFEIFQASNLYYRSVRGERSPQTYNAACGRNRVVNVSDDRLFPVKLKIFNVFRESFARHRQAVTMQIAAVEQRAEQHRYPPRFKHVLSHITAAGFEIGQIGGALEYFGNIKQIEFDPSLMRDRGQM